MITVGSHDRDIGASFERNGESQSIVDFDGYALRLDGPTMVDKDRK
jgi:hypothetical protein